MITKAMLARCQNEKRQAFDVLDEDVRRAIIENQRYAELYMGNGRWDRSVRPCKIVFIDFNIYRLSPNTPCELECVEYGVESHKNGNGFYESITPCGIRVGLSRASEHCKFIGIIYRDASGVETLRTTVDRAFGVPVRVRFEK